MYAILSLRPRFLGALSFTTSDTRRLAVPHNQFLSATPPSVPSALAALHKPPSTLDSKRSRTLVARFSSGRGKEKTREAAGASGRSRTMRLTAIHSFFRYLPLSCRPTLHRSSVGSPSPATLHAPRSSVFLTSWSHALRPLRIAHTWFGRAPLVVRMAVQTGLARVLRSRGQR